MSKKKAPAKKAPAKKAAKKLTDKVTRVYGATVFTMKGVDEKTAKTLMDKHGFRLAQRTEDGASLFADKMAFDSWKAAK